MRCRHSLLCSFLFLSLLSLNRNATAQAPICGDTCTPNMGSSSYGGAVLARIQPQNGRGARSPRIVMAGGPKIVPMPTNTVVGSQSYNYVVPILSLPGRNGLDLNLNLYYNSRIWDVDTANHTITFNTDRDYPSYGFRLDFGYIENEWRSGTWILTEADGTKRPLPSTDGSYITYDSVGNVLTYKNGTTVSYELFPSQVGQTHPALFRPTRIKDSNGNFISISYLSGHDQLIQSITDTVNRTISFNYNNVNNVMQLASITQNVQVSTNDPTGVHTYVNFTWSSTGQPYGTGYTWYGFSGLTVNGAPTNDQVHVITGCTYANGTGYRFTYGDWGIISKIEQLSATGITRSYISYNYPLRSQGLLTDGPAYTQQTVSPDGTANNLSTWTYTPTKAGTGVVTSMAVTDPLGNSSVSNLAAGLLSSVQLKDSTGTVLRTMNYTWSSSGANARITSIATVLNDTGQQSSVQYAYDSYGNTTDVYEYDFDSSLKRHTVTTYSSDNAYVLKNIVNLPTRILIKNGAGTNFARTDLAYDSTLLTAIAGASNHDDANFGSGMTTRGNLTSVTRYSNAAAGSGAITRTFNFDSLGNLRTAQLDCCNQEVFNFSSGTQYSYPDSVVRGPSGGPQFTTSATYNTDFGLATSATDENNQVTPFQYDKMMRLTQTTLPPQGGVSVQLKTAFDDSVLSPTVTSSTANSNNTGNTVSTFDGLGHVTQVDSKDGSSLISSVKYTYDQIWRRTQASNPFTTDTPVYTTIAYDGLSRVKQVTRPSGGYTQYQYSGNSVLITDPAGKQRKNFADALGRLIEVDEPGWGDALPSHGSVFIDGFEQSTCLLVDGCFSQFDYTYDFGSVSITVNSSTKTVGYSTFSTPSTVAVDLANAINGDSGYPVTASVSGSTVYLTAKQGGASTNYTLSSSAASGDPGDFGMPSFTGTPSGSTLSGGQDAVLQSSPSINRPLMTTYGYDTLDDLISVSQAAMQLFNGGPVAGQQRSYSYDSLRRLTSSTTPESGTVTSYYLKNDGVSTCAGDPLLVCRIQDARGIVKTLTYNDGINRLTGVSYSDGVTPSVTYTYDTGGAAAFALTRLTSISEGANSQTLTYDNFGRVTQVDNVIDSNHYAVGYGYNLLSQLTSITYPSGRLVNQTPASIGRLASISSGGPQYLGSPSYNAAGETLGFTLGNGVQSQFTYNDHLKLATLRYFKGSSEILNLGYDYTSTTVPGNNGQIQAVHYYTSNGPPKIEDTTKSELFSYDPWTRLNAAQTGTVSASIAGTWSLQWGYDRLGNRLTQYLAGGNLPNGIGQPSLTFDPATNRINGYCFDSAGNLTDTGSCPTGTHLYTFDGANRLSKINGGPPTYTYFGPLRIKKLVGTTTTTYIYSGSKPIAEYVNGSSTPSAEYIYAGGQLLVTIAGTSTTYHHPDHLSNRAETDASGTVPPLRTYGHFPFGETWYETGTTDKWKFTSYEGDSGTGETGLDYAMFRDYSSGLGRFMSPDLLSGHIGTPQSLNGYSYTVNEPIDLVDPMGLDENSGHTGGEATGSGCMYSSTGALLQCWYWAIDQEGNLSFQPWDPGLSGVDSPPPGGGLPSDPCFGGPCGDGSNNGGAGALLKKTLKAICRYTPDGRVTSLGVHEGMGINGAASTEQVVNWNTGQITSHVSATTTVGYNGPVSATGSVGLIWQLGNNNSNFGGTFYHVSGSGGIWSGSGSASMNGGKLNPEGPIVIMAGAGLATSPGGFLAGASTSSKGAPAGTIFDEQADLMGFIDLFGTLYRVSVCRF